MLLDGVRIALRQPDDHDVGVHVAVRQGNAVVFDERRPEPTSPRVILRETASHVADGDEARRREHADLPHAAAEHLPHVPCARDEGLVPHQHRAHRGAQALGEAHHDRVRDLAVGR